MAATAVTLVAVFREVGSILVVSMLVTPAAAARCCTDRLGGVLAGAVAVAGGQRVRRPRAIGRRGAGGVRGWWGWRASATRGVAGLTAVSAGAIFVGCALFGAVAGGRRETGCGRGG